MKTTDRYTWGWALFMALAGCSSSQTTATEATAEASAQAPETHASAAPPVAETATATATASAAPPPKMSGAPALKFSGATKISTTIGGPAKLELSKDHSVMAVPDGAMSTALLVTFMIDDKGKRAAGGTGAVYHLFAQNPPAEEPSNVTSGGPAFTFKLPVGKGTANLAVGEITRDGSGKETIAWKVIAPKSTEDGFATFELSSFTNDYLQITTAAPSS